MAPRQQGWYADPAGSVESYRWWDGDEWTRWLSDDATAAEPGVEPVAPPPVAPDRPTVALPLAVGIIVGALLLALLAISAVVRYSDDRLEAGPAIDPPPAAVHSAIVFDRATRRASVEEMTFVAPDAPFSCQDPNTQTGVFRSYFACDAIVHADYDGAGTDWSAGVAMGVLDDPLIVPGDLGASAGKVADVLLRLYPGQTTVKKRQLQNLTGVAPDGKAQLLSMEVHYQVKGLASRSDKVVIALVELADGELVAWFASNPDDSAKSIGTALDAAARTVKAQ